MKNALSIENI